MERRKLVALALSLALAMVFVAGCGGGGGNDGVFDSSKDIYVVSREPGSGTRGAFVELFKVEVRENGNRKDHTTLDAIITNKTDVMLITIAGDQYTIGYVSVGSLNDSVKALTIDGAAATTANIKNNSYKISRPFIIGTIGRLSDIEKDFIDFIMSKEGQAVVSVNNYVSMKDDAENYAGNKPEGKLVVAGSSSVAPVMEKLKEAYEEINTDARVEIQITDSTAGIRSLTAGTCSIAMSSRVLAPDESVIIDDITFAMDGIAVIVSKNNPNNEMTSEQVRQIFTGEVKVWNDIQ
ncbi:MAG: substrate-binding domain-containing protein [Peptococcaceae bacterium]|nr:substrate-binding domain-containing protein [Peptococcaceae bacterium]